MNPIKWWNALTPQQQASILAQRKTILLTANSAVAYLIAGAISANAFGDNGTFLAWLAPHWLIFLLAFFYAGGSAVAARRNDPPPPVTQKGP